MAEVSEDETGGRTCPSWCRLEHHETPVLIHEGETYGLMMNRPREGETEFLKIRTVEHLPLDIPDGSEPWGPLVELEHHVGDRYRVLNLTSQDARDLAVLLLAAAARSDEPSPSGTCAEAVWR
jgi:hypothetical protein